MTTNSITSTLLKIVTCLKIEYGKVNLLQKYIAKNELKAFMYTLSDPVEEVFFQKSVAYVAVAVVFRYIYRI